MRSHGGRLSSTRGVGLFFFAISLVVIVGMAGLAVDLGMLLRTRNEAQRAADGAALAGASAFTDYPPLVYPTPASDTADARARRVAAKNTMVGVPIDGASEVVQVTVCQSAAQSAACDLVMRNSDGTPVAAAGAPIRVLVKIRRAAVPTAFARVFGVTSFPIGATAVAEVALSGGGAKCIVPLAMPDAWTHSPPESGDLIINYSPSNPVTHGGTGFGSNFRNPELDVGLRVQLRTANTSGGTESYSTCTGALNGTGGNKCVTPGWWGLWGATSPVSVTDLNNAFGQTPCLDASIGPTYTLKNGWIGSLENNSGVVSSILSADPSAVWPDGAMEPSGVDPVKYPEWIDSPRVWTVGLFRPTVVPQTSDKEIAFVNFARFFFEGCAGTTGPRAGVLNTNGCNPGDDLIARFIGPAPGSGSGPGTLIRTLRLVK